MKVAITGATGFIGQSLSKIIKNGGIKSILRNLNSFIKNQTTVKFHFDIFHGNEKIDKAIKKELSK